MRLNETEEEFDARIEEYVEEEETVGLANAVEEENAEEEAAIQEAVKEALENTMELIGLTGEIRRVTRIEQRLNEAAKLGFKKVYAPKNSIVGIDIPEQIQVIGVTTLTECLKLVFG